MLPTLFFTFLSIGVLGFIAMIVNFIFIVNSQDLSKYSVVIHLLTTFFYIIGALGSLITGIMWAVVYLKQA